MKGVQIVFFSLILFIGLYASGQNYTEVLNHLGISVQNPSLDAFGSGLSFYDFNQDGWDDVSFAIENGQQVFLLNNQGTLEFAPFNIANAGETKMILWVDYDNDLDLDLFLTTQHGANRLWRNDGNFVFSDQTVSAGISLFPGANYGASFGDYDLDGDLDFYLCRYNGQGDSTDINDVNNLYQNNGDGTFTNVTWFAGVANGINPTFLSVWYDYNLDGWPDLFVINDRNLFESALYVNNQDGTFSDEAGFAGIVMANDNPMAGSFGDFDNDNDLDLFVGNTSSSIFINDSPRFFVNQNDGTFSDERALYGLELSETTWGGVWVDYDNDLDQDLYIATDYLFTTTPFRNYFMRNEYPNPFVDDTTIILGSDVGESHAVARGDINRDGFYDLAVHTDTPSVSSVWQNSGNANNYIRLTLKGTVSNSMAIGSWIKVFIGGDQYTQYTFCGENFLGQNSQHHIFGLAQSILVDSIHVEYVSGIRDKYYDLSANQSYELTEGETSNFFEIDLQGNNPFCEGDTVSLIAPLLANYLWNTGDTTQTIQVWNEGLYTLTGEDSLGVDQESFPLYLNQIATPVFTSEVQDASCFGALDGSAFLSVQNQGEAYTIQWSNQQLGDSLLMVGEGRYSYLYVDQYGCQFYDTIDIASSFPINVQVNLTPRVNSNFGTIQLLINGGIPPYSILLNNELQGSTINQLDSGTYNLIITDENGCQDFTTVFLPFIDTTALTGISNERLNSIKVSPNPFEDFVDIEVQGKSNDIIEYQLVDVAGRILAENSFDIFNGIRKHKLKTTGLEANYYVLKILSAQDQFSFKLLKIK